MTTGKKVLSSFIIIVILIIAFWIIGGTLIVVDDKFRSGNVTKFGKDGFFMKTHEGTLLMGGGENMMATSKEPFTFSATDAAMIKELENVDSRKTVKLWYKKTLFRLPWRGDTKYYIYKMEIMPDLYSPAIAIPNQQNQNNTPAK